MNYFEHLWFAWKFAAEMLYLGFVAFLHGTFPWMHETTASDRIHDMHYKLEKLGNKPKPKNHKWN